MRNLTVLLVVTVLLLPTTAEAKCKYVSQKSDHVETKMVHWKSKWTKGIGARLGKVDGDFFLIVRVQSIGKRYTFDADTPLILHLSGDQVMSLTPSKKEVAHRTILGLALNHKESETLFIVEPSVFETLRTTELLSIDMHYKHGESSGIEHFEVGGKMARRTQEYIACVIDHP